MRLQQVQDPLLLLLHVAVIGALQLMLCVQRQSDLCFAVPSAMKPPTMGYCLPPDEIVEIVDQPPQPSLAFSPDRTKVHCRWTMFTPTLQPYQVHCHQIM